MFPAFAMTINKAQVLCFMLLLCIVFVAAALHLTIMLMQLPVLQGTTFTELGVDLTSEVFSHGQAYVAYSRVRGWDHLHILLPDGMHSARNIVSREVLDMSFHDASSRKKSSRPVDPHNDKEGRDYCPDDSVDECHINDLFADFQDELQREFPAAGSTAGHFMQDDDGFIDWAAVEASQRMKWYSALFHTWI